MNHYLKQAKNFLEVAERELEESNVGNNQVKTKDTAEKSDFL